LRTQARILALAGTLATCLAGCGGAEPPPEGPARRVILISCDTLRADRLGIYGYDRPVSPNLDAFAREALVFDEAYASAAHTVPALSSLFTSRLPDEIGATGNRKFIPAELMTLPELLAEFGIPSAAVVSNWALRRDHSGRDDVGIHQGFAHYDDRMTSKEKNRDSFERWAPETTAAAVEWLEERRPDGPFFLWVHYQDPHGPYTPPPELAAQFDRPPGDEPPLELGRSVKGFGQLPSYQALGDERRPDFYRNRYDAEIRFFDRALGELLDYLRREGLYEDSLIVFTADHGESLGEHDYWFCHGENVYREVVRVPLLIRPPREAAIAHDAERGGVRRVERVASLLDLCATSLAALGVEADAGRGLSLLGAGAPEGRLVAQAFFPEVGRARWSAISDGRWRLVWTEGVPGRRLFDVRADPGELVDRSADDPERVRRMIDGHRDASRAHALPRVSGRPIVPTEESTRALRALGYVDEE
jgi:arylsulfatase